MMNKKGKSVNRAFIMKLKDKVAVVTGAASGIGRATAIAFSREGAKVIAVDINQEGLYQTLEIIGSEGWDARSFVVDVTEYEAVNKMIEMTVKNYGRIDIEANIAGILVRKSLLEHTPEDWERVLKVNLTGVFNCIKAVAPVMMGQRYGKILNMGSIAGIVGYGYPSYSASKAGVVNLTRELAMELGPYNINVNAICPGVIRTPMIKPEFESFYISKTPLRRMGEPDDVTSAIIYLASDEASFINGTTLVIDGGAIASFKYFD